MNYISLNHNSKKVNFENALINGLAPDKGLYFPEYIPKLSTNFFKNIDNISNNEIAYKVIKPFVGNCVDKNNLIKIIEDTSEYMLVTGLGKKEKIIIVGQQYVSNGEKVNFE